MIRSIIALWRVVHAYLVTGLLFHGATYDDIMAIMFYAYVVFLDYQKTQKRSVG